MSWKEIKIGDLGEVITGNTPPKKNKEYYGSAYKFIKPTDMNVGERYTFKTEEGYSELGYEKYKKSLIPPYSTCVVTIGSIGKKITLTEENSFVNQAVNAVIPEKEKFDPFFVFYTLKNLLHTIKKADTGASSGRENVSKSNFMSIPVLVPESIEQQRKIASILSAYDDLIENNLKRIKLLEETAQHLYKEWFVNFRFPGSENTSINEETGLPEGWRQVRFDEIFTLNNGYAFKSKDYKKNGIPVVRTRDYSSSYHINITDPIYLDQHKALKYRKYLLQDLDILLIMVGASIGKYGIVHRKDLPALQNQNQWAIRVKTGYEDFKCFKVFMVENIIRELLTKRTGAARDFFRATFLKEMAVLKPSGEIVKQFNSLAQPLLEQVNNLLEQNEKLKEAKALLLPRLMNRTIEV